MSSKMGQNTLVPEQKVEQPDEDWMGLRVSAMDLFIMG